MTNLGLTIAPRSDQLNSDDLATGPRVLTVTAVKLRSTPDQPVAINFEGDNGKPYLPCKSMRRVLVRCWGLDGHQYVGRSMRVYRDEDVLFGGVKVGGIRISHLSHLDGEVVMALTVSKASRKPFKVLALRAEKPAAAKAPDGPSKAGAVLEALLSRVAACASVDDLQALTGDETVRRQRAWFAGKEPASAERIQAAVEKRLGELETMEVAGEPWQEEGEAALSSEAASEAGPDLPRDEDDDFPGFR